MRHRIHILFALTALVSLFFSCSPLGLKISFHDSNSLLALHQDDIEEGSRFYAMKFRQKVAWMDGVGDAKKTFTLTKNGTPIDGTNSRAAISSLDKSIMYLMFRDADIQIDDTVEIEIGSGILKLVEDESPITSTLTITKKAVKDETGPEVIPFISENQLLFTKGEKVGIPFKEEIRFLSSNVKDSVAFKLGSKSLTINTVSIIDFGGSSDPFAIPRAALELKFDETLDPGKLSVNIKEKVIEDIHGNPNIPISFEVEISESNSN